MEIHVKKRRNIRREILSDWRVEKNLRHNKTCIQNHVVNLMEEFIVGFLSANMIWLPCWISLARDDGLVISVPFCYYGACGAGEFLCFLFSLVYLLDRYKFAFYRRWRSKCSGGGSHWPECDPAAVHWFIFYPKGYYMTIQPLAPGFDIQFSKGVLYCSYHMKPMSKFSI